ncbi:MAG TPA: hypothetical protein DEQ66_00770 [Prevotella sp.]|jgi:hypothetical protein|nr:hypothetical protein [Prevotella sp.]
MIKIMDTKFDFKQVGKRMPYSTPDGFLKDMESNILEAVKNDTSQPVVVEQKKRPVLKVIWSAALAAAASVALLFVVNMDFSASRSSQADSDLQAVDQAFAQLSSADQAFLLDAYQDDVFLNN